MRSVAGEKFQFVWNPDAAAFIQSGYNVALAYPGNAYVNDIGLDAYDESWATPQTPTNAWNETTLPALTAARAFAAAQGKPLAFCEWGIAFTLRRPRAGRRPALREQHRRLDEEPGQQRGLRELLQLRRHQ